MVPARDRRPVPPARRPSCRRRLLGPARPAAAGAPVVVARADDDPAVLLLHLGTTASAEGRAATHANSRHKRADHRHHAAGREPDDVVMAARRCSIVRPVPGLNAAVSSGVAPLSSRGSTRGPRSVMERDRVTVFEGAPRCSLRAPARRAGRHLVAAASACPAGRPPPVQVPEEFESGLAPRSWRAASETLAGVASFNHPGRERKAGSIGTPVQGVEMRLVDDTGNDVATGEVGGDRRARVERHAATTTARGDPRGDPGRLVPAPVTLARQDDDGYFFIVDRKKSPDHPRRLQRVPAGDRGCHQHPAVAEAAVVGVPQCRARRGGRAAVALRAESTGTDPRVRVGTGRGLLPAGSWSVVDFVAEGALTGKILRREVTTSGGGPGLMDPNEYRRPR
ncbi:AMP-binding protein [Pseudonocardia sp. MCCB 268]|nr:AMP-binding protein [Pseudonocardia cytotoxica]